MLPARWISATLSVAGLLATAYRRRPPHVFFLLLLVDGHTRALESSFPDLNYCPHCFQSRGPAAVRERGGGGPWPHFNGERAENGNYIESDEVAQRHGICGDPEQTAAEGSNLYGLENSNYPVLETYAEGGILEVKIVVSTYHWGHIEMFVCNAEDLPGGPDSAVTQSCLNKYPLDRAADDEFNQPIDPANRGRFFLDPSCRASETDQELLPGAFTGDVATARFQLPEGLTCERCIVQMAYYTGNSCMHQGYAEFNPPSWPSECAPSTADWIQVDMAQCGEGDAYPEEFWNCADVAITSDGGPDPAPVPTPQPDEEVEPSPAPVDEEEDDDNNEDDEDEYDEPTPSPVHEHEPATPMDEPYTPTEGTFAPSVPPPVSPTTAEWENPIGAYNQCGGTDYEGSTCCRLGYECEEMSDCYSECRPSSVTTECSEGWGQCGGIGWDGPSCCYEGAECRALGDYYSQCRPSGNY